MNSLLLLAPLAVLATVSGRSTGPPVPAPCSDLRPGHPGSGRTDPVPVTVHLSGLHGGYVLGSTITVRLNSTTNFKGFMIQARANADGSPLGTFSIPSGTKSQPLTCDQRDDSAGHTNSLDVTEVTVNWIASTLPDNIASFIFYYSIVQSYNTYWVMAASSPVPVAMATPPATTVRDRAMATPPATTVRDRAMATPPATTVRDRAMATPPATTVRDSPTETTDSGIPLKQAATADIMVRLHGSLMFFAWGVLGPLGIMLSLLYKIVCPNGQWFYSHIGIMLGTLVFACLGVVPIVYHGDGRWLDTTELNFPHQIMGCVALLALGVNPFIAICRCDPSSPRRWIYNWIHGSVGLLFGETVAFGAIMLGLHILREFQGVDLEYLHYAIYSASGTVALLIAIAAFINIYTINYSKNHPSNTEDEMILSKEPSDFPLDGHMMAIPEEQEIEEDADEEVEEEGDITQQNDSINMAANFEEEEEDFGEYEEVEESQDCLCRSFCGVLIVFMLLVAAAVNITLLAAFI